MPDEALFAAARRVCRLVGLDHVRRSPISVEAAQAVDALARMVELSAACPPEAAQAIDPDDLTKADAARAEMLRVAGQE